MTSALAGPPVAGVQKPRVSSFPPRVSSAGEEAIELARMAGLNLDPWEELVISNALGERANGKWAAFEVGLVVPRQNGKGSVLEARELAGLFLLGERLIIHSAHQFDTSLEAFRRLLFLIEETPDFDRRVKRVSRAHGEEGIELRNGQRIRFRTRTRGGGRGFTSDCLILDEAMILPESAHGALLPTLAARPNPQVWYAGSAVDKEVHEHGVVFARIHERGNRGGDPDLSYTEWSVNPEAFAANPDLIDDPAAWGQANPGMGIRISEEHIARERASMAHRTFIVERLGIGDWPSTDPDGDRVITRAAWEACVDPDSTAIDPLFFSFDVTPDRSSASIAVGARRSDGLAHIEVIENRRGTGWVVDRLVELVKTHKPKGVTTDASGPAASLLEELENRKVKVVAVSAREHAQACGVFFDSVAQKTLRHLGTPEMEAALAGASTRPLSEAWAWSRKNSSVDISPLVACTLAHWDCQRHRPRRSRFVSLADALAEAEKKGG